MRRGFACVMILLVLLQTGALATAPEGGGEPPPTPPDKTVMDIRLPIPPYSVLLECADQVDVAALSLPEEATCILEDWNVVLSPIVWDTDAVDISRPGFVEVKGVVALPEGYVFPGGDLNVHTWVYAYDPEQVGVETIVGAWAPIHQVIAIAALGSERSTLERYFQLNGIEMGSYTLKDPEGGGYTFVLPTTYDLSLVDLNQVGSYEIFSPPPAYFQYGPVAKQAMALYVIDPDEVDLRAWLLDGFGTITIEWIYEVQSPELWVSVDEGEWQPISGLVESGLCTEPDWLKYAFTFDYNTKKCNRVQIVEDWLLDGHTYEFEVRYENEGVSVNSLILDLREGHSLRYGNGGGSRGGDDREEEVDPPPVAPGGDTGGSTDHGGQAGGGTSTVKKPSDTPGVQGKPVDLAKLRKQVDAFLSTATGLFKPKSFPTGAVVPQPTEQPAVTPAPEKEPPAVSAPPAETPAVTPAAGAEAPKAPADSGNSASTTQDPLPLPGEAAVSPRSSPQPELSVVASASPPAAPSQSAPQTTADREETLEEPPVPMGSTADAAAQPPVSGTAAVVLVAGLGVLGTALLWKLLGKRLVKRP